MYSLAIIQERNDNLFRCQPANENSPEWGGFYQLMRETECVIRQHETHVIDQLIERGRI